jgi:hypothetical protein
MDLSEHWAVHEVVFAVAESGDEVGCKHSYYGAATWASRRWERVTYEVRQINAALLTLAGLEGPKFLPLPVVDEWAARWV